MRAALLAAAAASVLALAACEGSSLGPGGAASTSGPGGCTAHSLGGAGGADCYAASDDCTNCVQSVCIAEATACMADTVCTAASDALLGCLCNAQHEHSVVTGVVCEHAFLDAGSTAVEAAACLEAQCACLCGWTNLSPGAAP
jgi:hypothetical protein